MENSAYESFKKLLESSVYNIAQSFYDDYVEVNCEIRSRAGLKQIISRRMLGGCCDWCAAIAGTYEASNAPDDIYKRHRYCMCLVTVSSEKGYTDAWSKKTFKSQKEARINKENEILKDLEQKRNKNIPTTNAKKRIDKVLASKYYNSSTELNRMRTVYNGLISDGWFSATISFNDYIGYFDRIEQEIIGLTTINGIEIKSQSNHFIARVIGVSEDPITHEFRRGVPIEDIKEALFNGKPREIKYDNLGRPSQRIISNKCIVTVNPETGELITVNPR